MAKTIRVVIAQDDLWPYYYVTDKVTEKEYWEPLEIPLTLYRRYKRNRKEFFEIQKELKKLGGFEEES